MSRDVKVNDYIATFNALLAELGWQRNHPGTVKAFRAGLQSWIPQRIYDRDQYPREDDLDGWQEAARKEVSRSKLKKQEAGGAFGKGGLTVRENLLNNFLKAKKGRRIDDDAMDIDTTEIRRTEGPKTEGFKKLNPEERKKLQTEGRCFKCKRQGHLARNCPSRGQGSRTPQGREFQKRGFKKKQSARTTETADEGGEENSDEEETLSQTSGSTKVDKDPSLMAQINKLGLEEKEAIFSKLINEGF